MMAKLWAQEIMYAETMEEAKALYERCPRLLKEKVKAILVKSGFEEITQELKNQNGTLEHGNADLLRPVPGGRDARGDPRLQRNQHGDEPDRRPDRKPGHLL